MNAMTRARRSLCSDFFLFCFTPPLSFTRRFWGDDWELSNFCQRAKEMFEKQELRRMSLGVDDISCFF